ALFLVPLVAALVAREPPVGRALQRPDFAEAFAQPFMDFFRRHGVAVGVALLVFGGLCKLPDQMLGAINGQFYSDTGDSKEQMATVSKLYGVWIGIGGAVLGGVAVSALGLRRSVVVAALALAVSNLLYLLMAVYPGANWAF